MNYVSLFLLFVIPLKVLAGGCYEGFEKPLQSARFKALSNSYPLPIVLDGQIWPSVEHYFQAQKFVSAKGKYTEQAMEIRTAGSPAIAVEKGRDTSGPLRADWEQVKESVMFKALKAKFTQYEDLYDLLASTQRELILEYAERNRPSENGEDSQGKPLLGRLLVELQNMLKPTNNSTKAPFSFSETWASETWAVELNRLRETYNPYKDSHPVLVLAKEISEDPKLSDLAKRNRLKMIRLSPWFFHYELSSGAKGYTSGREWADFINKQYPADFRYRLAKVSIISTHGFVNTESLKELDIPHREKLDLYRDIARYQSGNAAGEFASALPHLALSFSELRELYFYSLQFHANTQAIKNFPRPVVNEEFIRKAAGIIEKHRIPARHWRSPEEAKAWPGHVLQGLREEAVRQGLSYRPVISLPKGWP